jgi:hypothetical protein
VNRGQCRIRAENAPPGFWRWSDKAEAIIDGVELQSSVPTRFFQSVDTYPPEWGRLSWRVQVNALDGDCATTPSFRTFYPGVEWNLARGDGRWFLSAWLLWNGAGPPGDMRASHTVYIEGDTISFEIAKLPERSLFLRCRVDARDRRSIAEEVRARESAAETADDDVIVLDDILSQ